MTAMQCLLCLESTEDPVSSIKIDSTEWKEQCIESIIEKHLWPMATLISKSLWLCSKCWQTLYEFHIFYRRIGDAHLYHECLVRSENELQIESSILLLENLIIPETRMDDNCMSNQDHSDDNDVDFLPAQISKTGEHFAPKSIDNCQSTKNYLQDAVTPKSTVNRTEESVFNATTVKDETSFQINKKQDYENEHSLYDSDDSIEDSTADSHNSNSAMSISNERFQTEISPLEFDDFLAKHFKITCVICQKPFKTFSFLQRHFMSQHKKEGYVFCCHKKIKRRSDLVEHIYSHLHPDYLKCKYCDKVLMGRRSLLRHVAMHERKANKGNTKIADKSETEPTEKPRREDTYNECLDENYDDNIPFAHKNQSAESIEASESEEEMDEDDIPMKSNMLEPAINKNPLDVSNTEDIVSNSKLTYQSEICPGEYDGFIAKYFAITCNVCEKSCRTFAMLRQHFAAVHKKEAYVTCCGRKIKRPRCLYEHIHSHLNPDYFKCKYCVRVLKNRRNLLSHIEAIHKEKLVRCKICNKKFVNKADMEKHKSTHMPESSLAESPTQEISSLKTNNNRDSSNMLLKPILNNAETQSCDKQISEKFQPDADIHEDYDAFLSKHIQLTCVLCTEPFTNFSNLRQHFTTHHYQEVYVLCCGRKHKRRRCLVEHIKSHLYPDYFKCPYCPKVLKERRHYLNHVSIHEGRIFRCDICDKTFCNKSEYGVHKQAHYPKEFACPDCNQSFDKNHQLRRHQAMEHSTKNESPKLEAEKEPKDKSVNETLSFIKIEINKTALDESAQRTMDQSFETDADANVTYNNDSLSDESQNSDSEESEDMEKYLPQTDPAEYDDFLAKHVKFTCSVCQEMCRNFAVLKRHFTTVHRQVGYVLCCGTKHRTRSFLVDHINTHLNPEYFKCNQCSKTFKERRGLISHIAWHKGKIYRCVVCQLPFLNKNKFKAHKLTHTSKEMPKFPCPDCGKVFGNKPLLAHHQKAIHDNKYVKLCDICGASFRSSECFKSHMENHRGVVTPSYPCDICGRILSGKRSLKIHKLSIHPEGGVLPYTCHICSKSVATQSFLNTHIRKSHSKSYNHKCSICGKAFKELKNLKTHMVIHTGVPLYTCTWCPKTFNSSGNLSSHRQRVHPKEWEEWKRKQYLGGLPPTIKNKRREAQMDS